MLVSVLQVVKPRTVYYTARFFAANEFAVGGPLASRLAVSNKSKETNECP